MADIYVKGGDFTPKNYLKVDAGGSHDENPNGGVQIGMDQNGVPNMLEEGEPVYNDFVYSDRIIISEEFLEKHNLPKELAGLLYSEAADKLINNYLQNPLDPIEKNGADVMLTRLAECQEEQKQVNEQQELERMIAELSPEEQDALMQMIAQGEQQPSPEEMAMDQQGIPQGQVPEEAMPMQMSPEQMALPGQMPAIAAFGGKINRYEEGGPYTEFPGLPLQGAPVVSPALVPNRFGVENTGEIAPVDLPVPEHRNFAERVGDVWGSDDSGAIKAAKTWDEIANTPAADILSFTGLDPIMSGLSAISGGVQGNGKQLFNNGLWATLPLLVPGGWLMGSARRAAKTGKTISRVAKKADKAKDLVKAEKALIKEYGEKALKFRNEAIKSIDDSKKFGSAFREADKFEGLYWRHKGKLAGLRLGQLGIAAGEAGRTLVRPGYQWAKQFIKNGTFGGKSLAKGIAGAMPGLGFYSGIAIGLGKAIKNIGKNDDVEIPAAGDVYPGDVNSQPQIDTGLLDTLNTLNTADIYSRLMGNQNANGGPINMFYEGNPLVRPGERYLEYTQFPKLASYRGFAPRDGIYDTLDATYVTADKKQMPSFKFPGVSYNYSGLNDRLYGVRPNNKFHIGAGDINEGDGNADSRLLNTGLRYAKVAGDLAMGIHNAIQPVEPLNVPYMNAEQIYNNLPLIDPRLTRIDINQSLNALNNQENAVLSSLRNSGNTVSTPASIIAADAVAGANRGTALAQDIQMNEQLYNQALSGVNSNAAARAQNDFNVNRYNAASRADARSRNAQLNLQKQMVDYQREAEKWAAISNQLNNAFEGLRGIGEENFTMNQINTNPYFEGYGISPYGMINYMTNYVANAKAAKEKAEEAIPKTPNPVASATASLQPVVPSYIDSTYWPDFAEEFGQFTRKSFDQLSPEAKEYYLMKNMLKGCGGKIKR